MDVYDFDNTIYDGESSLDFFYFCLKRNPRLLRHFPYVLYKGLKYKLGLVDLDEMGKAAHKMSDVMFRYKNEAREMIDEFWEINVKKLKPQFLEQISPEDLIISASPRFLFDAIKSRLNTPNIYCTEYDLDTGTLGFICFGKNKVKVFKEKYSDSKIKRFFSDSLHDLPMMLLAEEAYLIKRRKPPIRLDMDKYRKKQHSEKRKKK